MKKLLLLGCLLLIVNSGFCLDKVVAVVNDEVITEKELHDYLSMLAMSDNFSESDKEDASVETKMLALDRLIEDRLIVQKAQEEQLSILPEWVDSQVEEIIAQFESKTVFEDSLRRQGVSLASLKAKIEEQLLQQQIINKHVRSKIRILPGQITEYYKNNSAEFTSSGSVDYRALKFSEETDATQAKSALDRTSDVVYVLGSYSAHTISGRLHPDNCRKELQPVFTLEERVFSEVITIDNEFYIFFVDKKYPPEAVSLEQAQDKIWNILYGQKFKVLLQQWVDRLREDAVIKKMALDKS